MGKGKKSKTAIYHPPKSGMPFLEEAFRPKASQRTACELKDEARILASKNVMQVFVEDATPTQNQLPKPHLTS